MIFIQKDSLNDIVLTLSETSTGDNYLFRFDWEQLNVPNPVYYWSNTLITSERYDLFQLIDSSTGSTGSTGGAGSTLNLKPGQHKYNVYSSTQSIDNSNYLIVASSSSIEEGRVIVSGIDTSIDVRYN